MILVTGATGFIGGQLVRALLERGEPVRILARSQEKAEAALGPLLNRLEVAIGDLGDEESLRRAADGVEKVYHLASWVSFQAPLRKMRKVNVAGLRRLLEACVHCRVRRVLHMSSIAAGGPARLGPDGQYVPCTEEDPPAPLADAYGRTKLEQEKVVREYLKRGLECVIVRPSAVFGPGDPEGINTLLRLVRDGRLPFYLGSAQTPVNLVFVRDVVRGSIAAMERGRSGEIYNLVGANVTQAQLIALAAKVSGGRAPRWTMPAPVLMSGAFLVTLGSRLALQRRSPVHPRDIRNWVSPWCVSGEKAQRELGIRPTDLGAAIRETLAWLDGRG